MLLNEEVFCLTKITCVMCVIYLNKYVVVALAPNIGIILIIFAALAGSVIVHHNKINLLSRVTPQATVRVKIIF